MTSLNGACRLLSSSSNELMTSRFISKYFNFPHSATKFSYFYLTNSWPNVRQWNKMFGNAVPRQRSEQCASSIKSRFPVRAPHRTHHLRNFLRAFSPKSKVEPKLSANPFFPFWTIMSTLPPQIEKAISKVDTFMAKYPLICQDGTFPLDIFRCCSDHPEQLECCVISRLKYLFWRVRVWVYGELGLILVICEVDQTVLESFLLGHEFVTDITESW